MYLDTFLFKTKKKSESSIPESYALLIFSLLTPLSFLLSSIPFDFLTVPFFSHSNTLFAFRTTREAVRPSLVCEPDVHCCCLGVKQSSCGCIWWHSVETGKLRGFWGQWCCLRSANWISWCVEMTITMYESLGSWKLLLESCFMGQQVVDGFRGDDSFGRWAHHWGSFSQSVIFDIIRDKVEKHWWPIMNVGTWRPSGLYL